MKKKKKKKKNKWRKTKLKGKKTSILYLVLRQADGLELLVVDGLGLEVRGRGADERGLLVLGMLVERRKGGG